MRFEEARSVLGLASDATPEQAKKKYRELTKKYHPDVNKDSGAENKFKKINEAYSVFIANDNQTEVSNWSDIGRQAQTHRHVANISIEETVSFKESVLGCKKEIKFNRDSKCKDCQGRGQIPENNGCTKCNGRGTIINSQGGMISVSTCTTCYGRMSYKKCKPCGSSGYSYMSTTVTVSIPAGVQNDNILRLAGLGHYAGSFGPLEQSTDVFLHLKVTPETGLRLEGRDVVSEVKLSLLEALKGCSKNVKTISGTKDILINPISKNHDEVRLQGLGAGGVGDQRVILSVEYPEDLSGLIAHLEERKA